MRLAIMQPYFFPYLGYFQLINAVDKFVILDDVQYINRGWINKNKILLKNQCLNVVMPVKREPREKNINERYLNENCVKHKIKLLHQIEHAYKKAPFYERIFPVILDLLFYDERNISKFNTSLLKELCRILNINTPFYISSEIKKDGNLTGEARMININEVMGSKIYINPAGGVELYRKESFTEKSIELKFLITDDYSYKQFDENFIKDLSIIDIMMFNSSETINNLLNKYHLC